MRYLPTRLFTGLVLAKHEGINNSCPSPEQAVTSCCLILEQITSYRWYQLTSARRLTAWLLRHPSRWFDMVYSSSKLDCALDDQFPLLGQIWSGFCHCRHANWAVFLWCWAIWSVTAIFIFTEAEWGSSEDMTSVLVFYLFILLYADVSLCLWLSSFFLMLGGIDHFLSLLYLLLAAVTVAERNQGKLGSWHREAKWIIFILLQASALHIESEEPAAHSSAAPQ